jgi:nickel transport protein
LIAALAVFGLVQGAQAHGIWLAERWGEIAIVYGHGASDDPYDPAKISTVRALNEKGKPTVVIVDFDNGFYTEGADGKWVSLPRSKVQGARKAGRYYKHTLAIRYLHGGMPKLPEQDLQIVPLSNPTELSAG